jgi:hypothetical protein
MHTKHYRLLLNANLSVKLPETTTALSEILATPSNLCFYVNPENSNNSKNSVHLCSSVDCFVNYLEVLYYCLSASYVLYMPRNDCKQGPPKLSVSERQIERVLFESGFTVTASESEI